MYEFIQGRLAELSPAHAVIETAGGVGYYLAISVQTYSLIGSAAEAKLYTHFAVREDAQLLYGFFARQERELFRLLIGVSGVGGNTARMILSSFKPEELQAIIATGKAEILKSVKGLGIKTAQKIIVELKDKVVTLGAGGAAAPAAAGPFGSAADPGRFEEALAALTMLGFTRGASGKVLRQIFAEDPAAPVEEIIRLALKRL
jgi:Holliday junction DNA helicase RuvA